MSPGYRRPRSPGSTASRRTKRPRVANKPKVYEIPPFNGSHTDAVRVFSVILEFILASLNFSDSADVAANSAAFDRIAAFMDADVDLPRNVVSDCILELLEELHARRVEFPLKSYDYALRMLVWLHNKRYATQHAADRGNPQDADRDVYHTPILVLHLLSVACDDKRSTVHGCSAVRALHAVVSHPKFDVQDLNVRGEGLSTKYGGVDIKLHLTANVWTPVFAMRCIIAQRDFSKFALDVNNTQDREVLRGYAISVKDLVPCYTMQYWNEDLADGSFGEPFAKEVTAEQIAQVLFNWLAIVDRTDAASVRGDEGETLVEIDVDTEVCKFVKWIKQRNLDEDINSFVKRYVELCVVCFSMCMAKREQQLDYGFVGNFVDSLADCIFTNGLYRKQRYTVHRMVLEDPRVSDLVNRLRAALGPEFRHFRDRMTPPEEEGFDADYESDNPDDDGEAVEVLEEEDLYHGSPDYHYGSGPEDEE